MDRALRALERAWQSSNSAEDLRRFLVGLERRWHATGSSEHEADWVEVVVRATGLRERIDAQQQGFAEGLDAHFSLPENQDPTGENDGVEWDHWLLDLRPRLRGGEDLPAEVPPAVRAVLDFHQEIGSSPQLAELKLGDEYVWVVDLYGEAEFFTHRGDPLGATAYQERVAGQWGHRVEPFAWETHTAIRTRQIEGRRSDPEHDGHDGSWSTCPICRFVRDPVIGRPAAPPPSAKAVPAGEGKAVALPFRLLFADPRAAVLEAYARATDAANVLLARARVSETEADAWAVQPSALLHLHPRVSTDADVRAALGERADELEREVVELLAERAVTGEREADRHADQVLPVGEAIALPTGLLRPRVLAWAPLFVDPHLLYGNELGELHLRANDLALAYVAAIQAASELHRRDPESFEILALPGPPEHCAIEAKDLSTLVKRVLAVFQSESSVYASCADAEQALKKSWGHSWQRSQPSFRARRYPSADDPGASEQLEARIAAEPFDAHLLEQRSRLATDPAARRRDLEAAQAIFPISNLTRQLGELYLEQGEIDLALKLWERLIFKIFGEDNHVWVDKLDDMRRQVIMRRAGASWVRCLEALIDAASHSSPSAPWLPRLATEVLDQIWPTACGELPAPPSYPEKRLAWLAEQPDPDALRARVDHDLQVAEACWRDFVDQLGDADPNKSHRFDYAATIAEIRAGLVRDEGFGRPLPSYAGFDAPPVYPVDVLERVDLNMGFAAWNAALGPAEGKKWWPALGLRLIFEHELHVYLGHVDAFRESQNAYSSRCEPFKGALVKGVAGGMSPEQVIERLGHPHRERRWEITNSYSIRRRSKDRRGLFYRIGRYDVEFEFDAERGLARLQIRPTVLQWWELRRPQEHVLGTVRADEREVVVRGGILAEDPATKRAVVYLLPFLPTDQDEASLLAGTLTCGRPWAEVWIENGQHELRCHFEPGGEPRRTPISVEDGRCEVDFGDRYCKLGGMRDGLRWSVDLGSNFTRRIPQASLRDDLVRHGEGPSRDSAAPLSPSPAPPCFLEQTAEQAEPELEPIPVPIAPGRDKTRNAGGEAASSPPDRKKAAERPGAEAGALAAGPRRFVFGDQKFWEIELEGVEVRLRYGKFGAEGRRQTRAFDDAEAAAAYVAKQIQSKTKKGYVEES